MAEPRTGLSMGEHCERMAKEWGIGRVEQDELALASHRRAHAAADAGFYAGLVTAHAGLALDDNVRPDTSLERLARLPPVFDRTPAGTITAGNSSPLTDGASAVLLASDAWARDTRTAGASLDHAQRGGGRRLRRPRRTARRPADGAGARDRTGARRRRPRPRRSRRDRDARGVRRAGAVQSRGARVARVCARAARRDEPLGDGRPREAQSARQQHRARPSVRRDGNAHPRRARARHGARATSTAASCRSARPAAWAWSRCSSAERAAAFPASSTPATMPLLPPPQRRCRPRPRAPRRPRRASRRHAAQVVHHVGQVECRESRQGERARAAVRRAALGDPRARRVRDAHDPQGHATSSSIAASASR